MLYRALREVFKYLMQSYIGDKMLTNVLDVPYKKVREAAKIPEVVPDSEVATIYGSEFVATVGEVVSDLVFQPAVSKAVQVCLGALFGFAASLAPGPTLPGRGRRELMEISSHLLTRIVDPSPQQVREIKQNAAELVEAIRSMDAARLIEASLRSPREIKETVEELTGLELGLELGLGEGKESKGLEEFEEFKEFEFEEEFEEEKREVLMAGALY